MFFFQFGIIINVIASFYFIWIPVLWVSGHHNVLIMSERVSTLGIKIWRL